MTKFKYLYSILFMVFFLVTNNSIAQSKDYKPTLEQALREALTESKTTITDGQKSEEIVSNKHIAPNKINYHEKNIENKNLKVKKPTKTTLKSRKGSSDLMKALREEFNR